MSILDDAIREHLELKRAHGADESELKRLEDEAFGPPQRPDELEPFGEEAPTEFLGAAEGAPEAPGGRREPNIADLQEAPPPPQEEAPPQAPEAETATPPEAPAAPEAPPEPPSEEAHPATEHEAIPEPSPMPPPEAERADPEPEPDPEPEAAAEPDASHNTEERQAIAEQPTQFFDVEAEISGDEETAAEDDSIDVEALEPEPAEPEAASGDTAEQPALYDAEDDDFFSEQRLADELDQALEAPLSEEEPPRSRAEEPIPPGPHTEEAEAHYGERGEDEESDEDVYEPEDEEHDDVLEDTPDFLEDAPDADDAWFEQRPPKDFDFDD